jgi:uncharacterized protein (DUF4415 family)
MSNVTGGASRSERASQSGLEVKGHSHCNRVRRAAFHRVHRHRAAVLIVRNRRWASGSERAPCAGENSASRLDHHTLNGLLPRQQVTLHVDAVVLNFFWHSGARDQTRTNAALLLLTPWLRRDLFSPDDANGAGHFQREIHEQN